MRESYALGLDKAGITQLSATPDHTYAIGGGDAETRPVNRAVHWIIYAGEGG